MEPPRVDDVLARAVDEQVSEQRAMRATLQSVEHRIGALEERLARLEELLQKLVKTSSPEPPPGQWMLPPPPGVGPADH